MTKNNAVPHNLDVVVYVYGHCPAGTPRNSLPSELLILCTLASNDIFRGKNDYLSAQNLLG
jgi:hypothetical protein